MSDQSQDSGCGVAFLLLIVPAGLGYWIYDWGVDLFDGSLGAGIFSGAATFIVSMLIIGAILYKFGLLDVPGDNTKPWDTVPDTPPDVVVQYRNFRGEEKIFHGWRETIGITNNHANIVVAPDKVRIALDLDRILNRGELDLPVHSAGSATVAAHQPAMAEPATAPQVPLRLNGPEAERCPNCSWTFLVENDGLHECGYCGDCFLPKDLGWKADTIIGYRNHEGEDKQFGVLWDSITSKGNTISVRVEPTFQRITLTRERMMADRVVRYRNFRGEEKEFEVIGDSMKPKGAHVNVWVAPTFTRIALKRENILEERDLEVAVAMVVDEPVPPVMEEPTAQPEPVAVETTHGVAVRITAIGQTTYDVTKVLQQARPELGVFDVYGLIRNLPSTVVEDLSSEEAEALKQKLEEAGCTVELE